MSSPAGKRVIIVGAGPAGLAAAEVLAQAGIAVTIHDRMPNPARKFLLAGRGGLNLTHSEDLETFLTRYGDARTDLEPAIRAFAPDDLRSWCESLGIETFVGSSGRVFPKQMKASPLLRAWLGRLAGLGVQLVKHSNWTGWDSDALTFDTADGPRTERPSASIFALGGASWPRLGSDGSWQSAFAARGVAIAPLRPANSGFLASWSPLFRQKCAGQALKRILLRFEDQELRGEALLTTYGVEGNAIYALSNRLREAIASEGRAELEIDLLPDIPLDKLAQRLAGPRKDSVSNRLRKAGLSAAAASFLREDDRGPQLPADPLRLAHRIKQSRIRLTGVAPIERAISTAGGVTWSSLNAEYSLKSIPNTFVAGEMLDWEAPTGGYLLQACFATGRVAARGVLARLASS
ncbi:MAG: TIGR03862 family flavoprotein [Hyphomonadaceae bacterium]